MMSRNTLDNSENCFLFSVESWNRHDLFASPKLWLTATRIGHKLRKPPGCRWLWMRARFRTPHGAGAPGGRSASRGLPSSGPERRSLPRLKGAGIKK